jgi:hypothetical protein
MAAVAPHDVAIYVQNELVPGVMGEVHRDRAHNYNVSVTFNHAMVRSPLIEAKIRELYDLQGVDRVRIIPGEVYDNLIKYEIYRIRGPGNFQAVVRPKKPVGGKRSSTRKTKRRTTRRLKPKRR